MLVVENPRLVEAAAQRRLPAPVLTTNGNPSSAVTLALGQLADSGAVLRYHGDFDSAGLGMADRAAGLGCQPWRMGAADYRDAVQHAEHRAVELPRDPAPAPATPWDLELATEFDRRRAVVHEERVMDELLTEHVNSADAANGPRDGVGEDRRDRESGYIVVGDRPAAGQAPTPEQAVHETPPLEGVQV